MAGAQGRAGLMGEFGFATGYHSPVADMNLVGQYLCLWTELINPIHLEASFILAASDSCFVKLHPVCSEYLVYLPYSHLHHLPFSFVFAY